MYARPMSARPTSAGACSSWRGLLPTPTATFIQDVITPERWLARRARMRERHGGTSEMGLPLGLAVRLLPSPTASEHTGPAHTGEGGLNLRTMIAMLPTPRASDGSKGSPNQHGSKGDLTLSSAAYRIGEPTARRSRRGRSSPAPHPGQLTIEDA